MELKTVNHLARTTRNGSDTITIVAGKSLKIETSPEGEEILDEEVPEGKVWEARISVNIVETDA